jgi:hypothetical protein
MYRQYDPELGRWLSPDPSGAERNAYAFVGNRPTTFLDPDGLVGVPRLPPGVSPISRLYKLGRCAYAYWLCSVQVDSACEGRFGTENNLLTEQPNQCNLCKIRNMRCCQKRYEHCITKLPFVDPRQEPSCQILPS